MDSGIDIENDGGNQILSALESLAGFPVVIPVLVHWGDQDAFSHVNNTVYLRWAETARIEYLRRIGIWQQAAIVRVGPILASVSCKFLRPMTYPDTAYVGAHVIEIGNSSFKMTHRIVSADCGLVTAEVESTLVWFDYSTGKSVEVPPEMRDGIGKLESVAHRPPPMTP